MVYFYNRNLEIWEPTNKSTIDLYTGEKQIKYEFYIIADADVQQITPESSMKEYGKILEDAYRVFIDTWIEINPKSILRMENTKTTYQIRGTPELRDHILPYVTFVMEKQRTPTPLEDLDW
ncbi:MAG: hypothetical protein K1X33_05045 [Methanobacteriaceae archaeon]|nr:hypothetical protein [Methanobacteriaceae archaeon]